MTGAVQSGRGFFADGRLSRLRQKNRCCFSKSQNTIFTTDVYSELAFTMENAGIEPVEIRKRIKEAAEQFSLSEFVGCKCFRTVWWRKAASSNRLCNDAFS